MGKYGVCKRKECKFFNRHMTNNCEALRELYQDDNKCKFFKLDDKGEKANEN